MKLAEDICKHIGFQPSSQSVHFDVVQSETCQSYTRKLINYSGESGEKIPAFLLVPEGQGPFPAIVVHHQHNSEWHLGKSEVCGLAGDPLNAFGSELAKKGFIVLAPDSVNFEDRRVHCSGIRPHDNDWLNNFNGMPYRLVNGKLLMLKVLNDI